MHMLQENVCSMQASLRTIGEKARAPHGGPMQQRKSLAQQQDCRRRMAAGRELQFRGSMCRCSQAKTTECCIVPSQMRILASHPWAIFQCQWLLNEMAQSVWSWEVVCVWHIRYARCRSATRSNAQRSASIPLPSTSHTAFSNE